jgi:glycosyltransferase involved in cell wall biosynthesis
VRILIVSDAWFPQVNGVVRTLSTLRRVLKAEGHEVVMVTPDLVRSVPMPGVADIQLALWPGPYISRVLDRLVPDAVHIATEGPLGWAARRACLKRGLPFTTAYHTKFPEYLAARVGIPERFTYRIMRRFHGPSRAVMVPTMSVLNELAARGFTNLRLWSRGVDTDLFQPLGHDDLNEPRPICLYVGRVAPEKNIDAFLSLDVPGTKIVVGDGPLLEPLKRRYPNVRFPGAHFGLDLARYYSASDVFVFPSRTDTFGLVLLEALACGLPVAAYPVAGPLDVLGGSSAGCLSEDLGWAIEQALAIPREACRSHALRFTWARSAEQFVANLQPIPGRPQGRGWRRRLRLAKQQAAAAS